MLEREIGKHARKIGLDLEKAKETDLVFGIDKGSVSSEMRAALGAVYPTYFSYQDEGNRHLEDMIGTTVHVLGINALMCAPDFLVTHARNPYSLTYTEREELLPTAINEAEAISKALVNEHFFSANDLRKEQYFYEKYCRNYPDENNIFTSLALRYHLVKCEKFTFSIKRQETPNNPEQRLARRIMPTILEGSTARKICHERPIDLPSLKKEAELGNPIFDSHSLLYSFEKNLFEIFKGLIEFELCTKPIMEYLMLAQKISDLEAELGKAKTAETNALQKVDRLTADNLKKEEQILRMANTNKELLEMQEMLENTLLRRQDTDELKRKLNPNK